MSYFYTALLEGETVLFAEHYAEETQARKRASQFASAANEGQAVYLGTDPSEAIRKASLLTPPEIDDTEAKTPLPAWAIAQHEVEIAERHVIDAKEAHVALQLRADNLAEEAYSSGAASLPEDVKGLKRQRAVRAQAEADQAQARLYHAEGDYAAKATTYRLLMDAEREGRRV